MGNLKVDPKNFADEHKRLFGEVRTNSEAGQRIEWLREAIKHGTATQQYYRIYGKDIDGDILTTARFELANKDVCKKERIADDEATYYLRLVWRVLMRNYAVLHALRMEMVLAKRDGFGWLFWRLLSAYSMPRLAAAVSIGFFAEMGAADLTLTLGRIGLKSEFAMWMCLAGLALMSYFLAMTDVQRRVGRRWRALYTRSAGLTILSGVYGWIGYCSNRCLARWLGEPWEWKSKALCAGVAILLAHLLQLFWQDRSIADPL